MSRTQVFVGSVGGGFGGGDEQTALSSNNNYVVFNIGNDKNATIKSVLPKEQELIPEY